MPMETLRPRLAAARCEALWEMAAENRKIRPRVDRTMLHALTAGLDSLRWIDPWNYVTLLQPGLGPGHALLTRDMGERERLQAER